MNRPNLARQPFLDVRPVWVTAAAVAVLAVGMTAASLLQFFSARGQEATYRRRLETLQTKIAAVRADVEGASRRLGAVDWKRLEVEVGSVQGLVGKRRFAWSNLLSDLERVVPWDVRLTSITPTVDDKGVVSVVIRGVATNRKAWLDLLARCFADAHFSNPVPMSEEAPASGKGPGYTFDVRVNYWPEGKRGTS
ncbi:MAG: hypothetical protein ACM3O7_10430 [Acidobacteriota bacterium]